MSAAVVAAMAAATNNANRQNCDFGEPSDGWNPWALVAGIFFAALIAYGILTGGGT